MDIEEVVAAARRRQALPDQETCRLIRKRAQLTIGEVAEALQVDYMTVWRWETGRRKPQGAYRERYAALLQRLAREMAA